MTLGSRIAEARLNTVACLCLWPSRGSPGISSFAKDFCLNQDNRVFFSCFLFSVYRVAANKTNGVVAAATPKTTNAPPIPLSSPGIPFELVPSEVPLPNSPEVGELVGIVVRGVKNIGVGDVDGLAVGSVGASVGACDGEKLGPVLGSCVGDDVGTSLGWFVGMTVGLFEGAWVGLWDGEKDGFLVGVSVGCCVGLLVLIGEFVGDRVGETVGKDVVIV
eukprot:snap_masked-scaffold_24-processed-gene-0.36-mRNA-1 protein AED:0.62 eAED:0.62 QI:0/0/0/1/1/1/2/0/218